MPQTTLLTQCLQNNFVERQAPLRVDWLDQKLTGQGRLGLTLLPGRQDYGRSLAEDLSVLKKQGVSHIVCLVTPDELNAYGVDTLLDAYQAAGFIVYHLPILDRSVCSLAEMTDLVVWLTKNLTTGANILLHCVGGLGRSGLVAGCYLTTTGLSTPKAIAMVRQTRSPCAIETESQETFIQSFDLSIRG